MHNFAPVLIPTLNRYIHFKRCVESLAQCTHAKNTDLFIALDYPLNESHVDGYKKIKNYLPMITGFNTVKIIERDRNYGAMTNIQDARLQIYEIYDRIIVSEDDNEFSPNFLDYINKGLNKFKDNSRVLAVCGYSFPINIPSDYVCNYNYYYYQRFSAWGFGMWKGKIRENFVWDYKKLTEFIENKQYSKILKRQVEKHYYKIIDCIKNKNQIYGDGVLILIAIMHNSYYVHPTVSKVRNYGNDGTGEHSTKIENDIYKNQKIDMNKYFDFHNSAPIFDKSLDKTYRLFLKISFKNRLLKFINSSKIGCMILSFIKKYKWFLK